MSELRDLIETASADLDRYKHPDITEAKSRIEAILAAGKLGSVAHDRIESLNFTGGELCISTVYSVRGCTNSDEYRIPEEIIDADDPIAAVKVWAKNMRIDAAMEEVIKTRRLLAYHEEQLEKVQQED